MRFLGQIDGDAVHRMLEQLTDGLRGVEPFEFTLDGFALFPSANRPRVIAAGITNERAVARLAHVVEEAVCNPGGSRAGRRFRPHISVGRFRRPPRQQIDLGDRRIDPTVVTAADVVLYRSILDETGARYRVLGRVALGASAGVDVPDA